MKGLTIGLHFAADNGRSFLIAGLVAALVLPELATAMRPYLAEMVAGLLFLSALRIGPRAVVGSFSDLRQTAIAVAILQVGVPILVVSVAWLGGWLSAPVAVAIILMTSAPSVTGSPNFTIMVGHQPAPALRLLILGTALLPLTIVPVFWLTPELGSIEDVMVAAFRLLIVIGISVSVAFFARRVLFGTPSPSVIKSLDGLSAITLAVVVIGLMSAVTPALHDDPMSVAFWLMVAMIANFGLQIVSYLCLKNGAMAVVAVPFSIVAGNRNIALFFVALADHLTDPLLILIGCYQVPMYITPIIMKHFYRSRVT